MFQFILYLNNTVRVLDGLSVHHQEFKIVHTARAGPSGHAV